MLSLRLKSARKKSKMTQEELAMKVNTTKSTISNYENGHSTPSNDMLVLLSKVLEVTTDYLLGRSDNPNMTADEEFQEFSSNPQLSNFFRDIEASAEQEQEELRQIWEIIKNRRKKNGE
ncbi:hypothetical protein NCCP2222_19610 [Sporosarcina sp. NCCP-2222]|uniref:helix-turn-helix domain-containing protein n=1 Tax=Sporosarcina sp. NCCP-2222 TaxID=2935073 RepID=UPI0020882CC7|nr:helix-turn-helix transcriptional regulator [Sporosarcina sp. NCCP-2222]GKV56014.1 hypothetical protein NCCP2222_19610 [Sporosarcina sp. NCCP-2222]